MSAAAEEIWGILRVVAHRKRKRIANSGNWLHERQLTDKQRKLG